MDGSRRPLRDSRARRLDLFHPHTAAFEDHQTEAWLMLLCCGDIVSHSFDPVLSSNTAVLSQVTRGLMAASLYGFKGSLVGFLSFLVV